MDELINNPVVQSALLPFTVSLVVAVILRPHGRFWAGLSAVAGFATTVYLLTDFQFFPLRSHRKILLLGSIAVLVGLLLDVLPWRRFMPGVLFAVAAATALWVIWPVFRSYEGWQLWALAIAGPAYVGWQLAANADLRQQSLQADCSVFALALGTGLSTLLGATALYGQLASAIAAAVGAKLLLQVINKPAAAGTIMLVPLVLVCALLGLGAVVYSKLPWYSLLPFILIPVLARVPLPGGMARPVKTIVLSLITLTPALLAIFLTWQETGGVPI